MTNQTKLNFSDLSSYRSQHQGKPSGKYLRYYCPIHGGDHQRSLQVNPQTGQFICFTCGAWGYLEEKKQEWIEQKRLESSIAHSQNNWSNKQFPKTSFRQEAKKNIFDVKLPINSQNNIADIKGRPELLPILENLQKALPGSIGEEYLKRRKIPLSLAQHYGIGYAKNGYWPHLKDGKPVRQWQWGRIVFPHTNTAGEIVNLYGRAVERSPVPKEMKHDHLTGYKGVFNAQALTAETVFISEGPFNALSLITAGYKESCAIFGVEGLRWEWIKAKRIVFCFDKDSAGIKKRKELSWEGVLRGYQIFFLSPEIYGKFKDLNEVLIATGKLNLGDWKETSIKDTPLCAPEISSEVQNVQKFVDNQK